MALWNGPNDSHKKVPNIACVCRIMRGNLEKWLGEKSRQAPLWHNDSEPKPHTDTAYMKTQITEDNLHIYIYIC